MSTRTAGELAKALDDLVRRVPGVATLYRSAPLVARIVTTATSALRPGGAGGTDETLLLVKEDDEALTIAVTIGTEAEPAAATCRAVHDTIVHYLAEIGRADATVNVTVAHVTE